jgi:hypothetical protein
MGRPRTTRNSNGPGRPEIQTLRAFSGLGRAGPGGPNVHLYLEATLLHHEAATLLNLHAQAVAVQNIRTLIPLLLNANSAFYA